MIVLHACSQDNKLWLWGEVPAEEQGRVRKRGKDKLGALLPYNAGAEKLAAALAEVGVLLSPDKRPTESLSIWLPTLNGTPVASSSLIAELPPALAAATVAPWTVTAVPLVFPQASDLLCSCIGKQVLAPGVIIGSDLAFWAAALRFAGTLVAQQQFLPGLAQENGHYRTSWKPVVSGLHNEALAKLSKAMPHACRALTRDALAPPQAPASTVLLTVLGAMVDHLIRSANDDLALRPAPLPVSMINGCTICDRPTVR